MRRASLVNRRDIDSSARQHSAPGILVIGFLILAAGALFYWLTRPTESAAFLALLPGGPMLEGDTDVSRWLNWLPSFVHVLAFSILTWLAFGYRRAGLACGSWLCIGVVFELAQGLPPTAIDFLPAIFNLQTGLKAGVFDPLDLFACVLGAMTAWIVMCSLRKRAARR